MNDVVCSPVSYWNRWLLAFAMLWLLAYSYLAPHPLELANQNWYLIVIGFVGAVIGNLTAVGGGIVFIPVMIFLLHIPPVQALKLAIISQAFGMTSGAIGWFNAKKVDTNLLWMAVPGLLIGSTISTLLIHPSPLLVKGVFGPVSILIGIISLITMRGWKSLPSKIGTSWMSASLVVISMLGGLITGWVAIGEGEIVAAFLMLCYGLSSERSIGLGVVLLSINSVYLALLHICFMGGLPWEMGAFTVLGCVFGARLGPYIGQKISHKSLKVAFATIAISDGALFIYQFLLRGKR
jgi:uncharacterized membrane protein YfcA